MTLAPVNNKAHILTYLQLPTITPSFVLAEPGEELSDRHAFVLIRLAFQYQAALTPVLVLEIFRRPLDAELSTQVSNHDRLASRPQRAEDIVRQLPVVEASHLVARDGRDPA